MKNLTKSTIILSFLSFLTFFTSANADIKVVASIKPIHSLASYLMDGVAKPDLIVEGYASPHGFALKPSHAKMLQNADIVFWVGEDLENFLEKPLDSIAKKAEKIELLEIKGLNKLKFRERNIFDDHDDHGHDDHGHKKKDDHDDHDDHAKKEDDHDDHDHKKKDDHDDHDHAKKEDGHKEDDHDDHDHKKKDDHDDHDDHDGHEGHHHGEHDPHIWLDPINAKVILNEMVEHLIENDAKNASTYKSNLEKALKDIDKLTIEVMTDLNQSTSSIVFHDAYQYFEKRFGVEALGALTINTDIQPGAKQIAEIKDLVEDKNIKCIFSEPQFNPKLINMIAKSTGAKTGILDPLGSSYKPGKDLYFNLINDLYENLNKC